MARILYGVCGEGMGHASRSRILINYLKSKNHEVKIVAGGKAYDFLSKEYDGVFKTEWPTVQYKNNKVKIVHTLLRYFYRTVGKSIPNYFKVKKLIKEFKPELMITDAEPISFNAAFSSKIKRISIDNPQALLHRRYKIGLREIPACIFLCFAVKVSIYNPDKYLIYDFSDEQINNKKVLFLKPLIQEKILRQKKTYDDHVFVYQTSISNSSLFETLKKVDQHFVIYGMNKDEIDKNLTYKKFNEKEFYCDISASKAIISNGGFTTLSEALYLKKPIFSIPIKHQFEQLLNARYIEKLGAGVYHMKVDEKKLNEFFSNLESYKKNLQSYSPGDQDQTLEQIEEEIQKLLPA